MAQLIDKDAVMAEIEKYISNYKEILNKVDKSSDDWVDTIVSLESKIDVLQHILSFLNTLEVIDPYEQCVQYDSIKAGIQAHAETYSFNTESELFNQLTTEEQQKLWRKEIEQACISGGEMGVELARDPRYKGNLEVKEIDLEKYYRDFLKREWFEYNGARTVSGMMFFTAKHFYELGLKASNPTTTAGQENKWNESSIKPPFTITMDGNKYSKPMLCYDKFGNYCIAQYVRLQTGYCGWYDGEEEVSVTQWKELKAQKGE